MTGQRERRARTFCFALSRIFCAPPRSVSHSAMLFSCFAMSFHLCRITVLFVPACCFIRSASPFCSCCLAFSSFLPCRFARVASLFCRSAVACPFSVAFLSLFFLRRSLRFSVLLSSDLTHRSLFPSPLFGGCAPLFPLILRFIPFWVRASFLQSVLPAFCFRRSAPVRNAFLSWPFGRLQHAGICAVNI